MSCITPESTAADVESVKDVLSDPSFIVLYGLLCTEFEVVDNWNGSGEEGIEVLKKRVNYCIENIIATIENPVHDGDCVSQSCTCMLCYTIGQIRKTNDSIVQAITYWFNDGNAIDRSNNKTMSTQNERNIYIERMIRVVLSTNPKKSFARSEGVLLCHTIWERVERTFRSHLWIPLR